MPLKTANFDYRNRIILSYRQTAANNNKEDFWLSRRQACSRAHTRAYTATLKVSGAGQFKDNNS